MRIVIAAAVVAAAICSPAALVYVARGAGLEASALRVAASEAGDGTAATTSKRVRPVAMTVGAFAVDPIVPVLPDRLDSASPPTTKRVRFAIQQELQDKTAMTLGHNSPGTPFELPGGGGGGGGGTAEAPFMPRPTLVRSSNPSLPVTMTTEVTSPNVRRPTPRVPVCFGFLRVSRLFLVDTSLHTTATMILPACDINQSVH